VNYLGHFYLTKLLSQNMKENTPCRVINVVSDDFKKGDLDFKNLQGLKGYSNTTAYRNANLAMMYFTKELAKVFKDSGVTVNVVNPGTAVTSLWKDIFPYNWYITWFLISPYSYLFWKSSSMAAETAYYCALDRDLEKVSGKYFKDCKEETFPELEDEVGRKLWAVSERLLTTKRVSTLNQAAIKRALNDIAEAAKDRGEENAVTAQSSGGDVADGAQADVEDVAPKSLKVSVKKKKKISKKPKIGNKNAVDSVEQTGVENTNTKSESKTANSSTEKSGSKTVESTASSTMKKRVGIENSLAPKEKNVNKEKRSPRPGKKGGESKDTKNDADGKGENAGSLRNRKPTTSNDKKNGTVTKTRKKAAK